MGSCRCGLLGRRRIADELLLRQLDHLADHLATNGTIHACRDVSPVAVGRNLNTDLLSNLVLELVESGSRFTDERPVSLLTTSHLFIPLSGKSLLGERASPRCYSVLP